METIPETVRNVQKCSNASLAKWAAKHRWTVKCFRSLQISNVIQSAKCWLTPPHKVKCEIWAEFDWPPSDRNGTERLLKSASYFLNLFQCEQVSSITQPRQELRCSLSLYTYVYLSLSLSVSHCCAIFYLTDHQICALCLHITQPVAALLLSAYEREKADKSSECRRRRRWRSW